MKILAAISMLTMTFVNAFGSKSSVGGPLIDLFVSFLIMWAVGVYFAWSKRLGVLGWFLSVVAAIVGGGAAIVLLGTVMDTIFELVHFQGRLIDSNWSYLASAAMALAAVLGAWAPLELGRLLLARRQHEI